MTALDAAALERASAPAVELLGLRTVRDSGSGSAVTGFDAFGRVYLTAAVAEFQRGSRSDSVTLTVEQSADGLSWSTAATFEFTSDDVQFATVDAPADQLRVSWTVAGRLRSCRIVGVKATAGSLDSASGPGGGSAVLKSTPRTLNNAEIKALPGTDVELIASPGGGKLILPLSAILVADFAVAYNGIDADTDYPALWVAHKTSPIFLNEFIDDPDFPQASLTALLTTTNTFGANIQYLGPLRTVGIIPPFAVGTTLGGASSGTVTDFEDTSLKIGADNSINFGGGDAANTLTVTALYTVLDV